MGGKKTVENSRRFEKDRRDKLNVAFMELCKLLPDHDPSVILSKMEILRKAAEYIKYLQEQNDEIMKLGEDLALRSESEKLKKRVTHLLLKTKELVDALKCAGVPIPNPKRRKRKPKVVMQDVLPVNQNKTSDSKQEEVKTSKNDAIAIKKVKCGCMKSTPEKKPLKESNPTVTAAPSLVTLGSVSSVTCGSSVSGPPWTNHTKLLTVNPAPLISATVMTTRVQNVPVVKQLIPNNNVNSSTSLLNGGTSLLPNLKTGEDKNDSKNLPVRNGINSLPIVTPTIQTIPIISNNLLPSNIVKEMPAVINKKTVNIVTTTSSNSLPTQTIVNSTHLITLPQSNIISAPVVAPSIQTVPVLEKNILSNLGPGTLILADGRIMNVPPIVPQILVKPQPTVILMPSTKKKEKFIVPKKRDVTKTTFANKAPIPAIQTFRMESCPKIRPKRKPKTIFKKAEKFKSPENDTNSEQIKKKRKIEDLTNPAAHQNEINDKMTSSDQNLSIQVENKELNTTSVEQICKDNSQDEVIDTTTSLTSKIHNKQLIVYDSSKLHIAETEELPNSSSLTITTTVPSTITISDLNSSLDNLSCPPTISATSETFNSLSTSSIPPLSTSINEPSREVALKHCDLSTNPDGEKEESTLSNADGTTLSKIEQNSSNPNSSQAQLTGSSTVESSNIKTLEGCVERLHNDTSTVCGQSVQRNTSTDIQLTPSKSDVLTDNFASQNPVPVTSCSGANITYSESQAETLHLPEVRASNVEASLFVVNNEKISDKKSNLSTYSPQPQQTSYTNINLNQESSGNNCFQENKRLNPHEAQNETLPVSKPLNPNLNDVANYNGNSLLPEQGQHSNKPRLEFDNSGDAAKSKTVISSVANEKKFSSQQLIHNDLPDLGNNDLVENSSLFPDITQSLSLSGQEKIVYSQTMSFQQNNCNSNTIVSGVSNLSMVGNTNRHLSISENFNQRQTIDTQLNHSKLKQTQPIDPFYQNLQRQDAMVCSQTNVAYSKANESFSNHPSYATSEAPLSDKDSSLNYTNDITKSVGFNSNEKLPSCNSLPLLSSVNRVMSSNPNIYSGYCSANFYPTTTVTYSQNNFTLKSANKSTSTMNDNLPKKIIPYSSFNDPTSSTSTEDKHFYTQNVSFHHSSLTKSDWEKSNGNKPLYNNASSHLQEDNSVKDKNSSFSFSKMTGLEKQNESQIHSQLMYLGLQNETVTSHGGSFFQNFPSTSSVLQSNCGFNDIPSGVRTHNSVLPSKSRNHQENSLKVDSNLIERNSLEKQYNNIKVIDKGIRSIDTDITRNASFYLPSSQPSEGIVYNTVCSESLLQGRSNSFETDSVVKTKNTPENKCLSLSNFTREQKSSFVETHKAVASSSNSVQVNASHCVYNTMNSAAFAEGSGKSNNQNSNDITVDERRKINAVQNSYSQEKEVTQTNRFTEIAKLGTCNSSDSAKNKSQYSISILEKENITQSNTSISSASSKNVGAVIDSERNPENSSYNYVSKSSVNGKNIHNNTNINKIHESTESVREHYKDYIGNSTNNEKNRQENHKLVCTSSLRKSVSTEMNSDDFQSFNYQLNSNNNNSNYQKLVQPQNTSFTTDSSRISGTSVRTDSYANFDTPFDSLNNQYTSENSTAVNGRTSGVCSAQIMNHPLQLLPPTTSVSDQIASHSSNKPGLVSVMSHSLNQKENHATKIGPADNDGASFKGDMNTDFLKSKEVERNTFIPIIDDVRLTSDFSSDLFSSLQVPTGGQHSESISPTAAFLLAFPLVSTSRNIENLPDNENHDNQTSTPTTILQIGNIEPPSTEMFHPIDFQKNNKGNDHYEINSDYIHVNGINGKQNTSYSKACDKRKDLFPDFNKNQRTVEGKAKSKSSTAATNSYSTQSYNYSHFPCNDYQQYCEKEGPHWQQEFSNLSKEQKKTCEKKKDKGVQKGCFYQNYQEYYSYKDKKRKQPSRISVNWMTTPENREQADYQPKDPEIANNYTGHSSQPVYSSIPIDFPTEPFSDYCNSKKSNNYSWSPSKTLLPVLDNHLMIPSTLPTLVGDLALGTSTPSESYKTFEPPKVQPAQGQIAKKTSEKIDENKKRNEFPKSQANFFSVSQLVDPKSKKQKTADRNYKRQEKTTKPRANFNCSKRKDDHCMYYEERNNFVANQNQCTEKRHAYKGGSYSAESLIGAQQTEVDFSSNFNYQQNSNYFQSDLTTHIDSNQQYGYFQQTHFSGFSHDEYQDFGFASNQRNLDQTRQKVTGRKDDNCQGTGLLQPQIYSSYSKSIHYNLPSSQLNTNTTTTLTNFNLSTIFPEMNDQRVASSGHTPQQMNPSFPPSSQTYRNHLQQ